MKAYEEYIDTFREADGRLPEMMELKRLHTLKVVENAALIVKGEGFSQEIRKAAYYAALLHDAGRYEQLKRYNTFRDSDSVDHAVLSYEIVKEKGWLEKDEGVGQWEEAILSAILYHNRRELPGNLDEFTDTLSKIVRDADKLDIFRVLEERIATTDWRKERAAFWNLSLEDKPSAEVIAAIKEHRPVDYQHIRSLADFILIQVGWIDNGLYFETSKRLAHERGHLDYRLRFLEKELGVPEISAGLRGCEILI